MTHFPSFAMRASSFVVLVVALAVACCRCASVDAANANPNIWPLPMQFTYGVSAAAVDAVNFKFIATGQSSPYLDQAFGRFREMFFPNRAVPLSNPGAITAVTVDVADVNADLQLDVDESYTLTVPVPGTSVTITAPTIFGAYHALQTLSQMILFNYDAEIYSIPASPWAIKDAPRFSHRELLVDTARHYEPVHILKRIIDSCTYSKINVIHWHIVDSQSFPMPVPSRPLLSRNGAFSSQERYTTSDLEDVVEYAKARGVRMMVETDVPGHAGSWCAGYPEICPSTTCLQPLNVASNVTFDVITDILTDIVGPSSKHPQGLFFDQIVHLGGDEVDTTCWTNTPVVANWLKDRGLTNDEGYMYFVKRAHAIAHALNRQVVGWEEIWNHFGTQLDPRTIIHQWLPGSEVAKNATSHGYRVLFSTDGLWYLDGLQVTWEKMYATEPCDGLTDAECKLVLGGGGEMWGETADPSDVLQTIWPRLAAVGERLWSPRTVTDVTTALPRLLWLRCLMNRRGIPAAPVQNSMARSAPPNPGSCYAQ